MRFRNEVVIHGSRLTVIDVAIDKANELLDINSEMVNHCIEKKDWKYGVQSGAEVAVKLGRNDLIVPIQLYYARNPRSAQTAAWDGKRIGINGYWLSELDYIRDRNHYNVILGAIIHEWAHACGFHHQDSGIWGYFKRNYWSEHKSKHSVPYHLSDNIGLWVK